MRAYYFTHNWRGDIVGIYNGNGELRARYEYDSWGNVLSITDQNGSAITDENHIANLNPFRYRSYYMDTETGMYYLMSRYYDPVTHRFLNADGYFQTGLGILDANMNAYCKNNPIMNCDPMGENCNVHGSYPVANCLACNPDYRNYVRTHLDWYNRVTSSDCVGVNDDGTLIYGYQVYAAENLARSGSIFDLVRNPVFSQASKYISEPSIAGAVTAIADFPGTVVSVISHANNPYLNNWQKGFMVGMDITGYALSIGVSVILASGWNPGGFWGGVAICALAIAPMVFSILMDQIENFFVAENKKIGCVNIEKNNIYIRINNSSLFNFSNDS